MEETSFYRIDGIIEIPFYLTEDDFNNSFIEFCEQEGFLFSGAIDKYTDEQIKTAKEFVENEHNN